jgi:hypothetical protein
VLDLAGRVIRAIDLNAGTFVQSFARLPDDAIRREALETLRSLLGAPLDQLPRKLHLHQLVSKLVSARLSDSKVSAWSLHVTADDRYKASFTYEAGTLYFRLVDEHDVIDKRP